MTKRGRRKKSPLELRVRELKKLFTLKVLKKYFFFFQRQYKTLHEALAMFLIMLFIKAEKRQSVFLGHLEGGNPFGLSTKVPSYVKLTY